jgi:gamma-glutamyl-gamma-aminobutyrate hydrolase PuuD
VLQQDLADGLDPVACSGVLVESWVHRALPFLAVQWHPERRSPSREYDKVMVRTLFEKGAFWANRSGVGNL